MPRIGLVLSAGGAAGVAFHAGVLAGLAEATGWDPREADVIVGTSAGSFTGSALRAGLSASDQLARARGDSLSDEGGRLLEPLDAANREGEARGGSRFPVPERFPVGFPSSPGILRSAGMRPWRVRPGAVIAGLLPVGTVPTTEISSSMSLLCGTGWPERALWVCAVRLDDGTLTVFGREGSPHAQLCDAVAASCAIPSYFAPVTIDGVRYVDGGAHSLTNLSAVASEELDLVLVSAPMARAGRLWRMRTPQATLGAVAREMARTQLAFESLSLRRRGVPVVLFSATSRDRGAMGPNLMDQSRAGTVADQACRSTISYIEKNAEVRDRLSLLTGSPATASA